MKKLGLVLAAAAMVALAGPAMADHKEGHPIKGNGAPSGHHYNLNLVGVPEGKTKNTHDNGHVIFVNLQGRTVILLCNTTTPAGTENQSCDPAYLNDGFQVIDSDGTSESGDSEAMFGLPNPGATDGTNYSVFATGIAGNTATIEACAEDPNNPGVPVCNTENVVLVGGKGAKFKNVSRELLTIDSALCAGSRCALFSDPLEDYLWNYDNNGLRLAQLRFYWCSTDTTDPDQSNDCF
jgi:hypothetical protein